MAVQKLRFVNIIGSLERLDDVIELCLKNDFFHMENAAQLTPNIKGFMPITDRNPYSSQLAEVTELMKKLKIPPISAKQAELDMAESTAFINEVQGRIDTLTQRIGYLKDSYVDDQQILKQVLPVMNLNLPLGELYSLEYIKFRFGRLTKDSYNKIAASYTGREPFIFVPSSIEAEYVWGFYFAPRFHIEKADATFASLHFERIRFSDRADGIPTDVYEKISKEEEQMLAEVSRLEARLLDYTQHIKSRLCELHSVLFFRKAAFDCRKLCIKTQTNFFMAGWLPYADSAAFQNSICTFRGVTCIFENPDGGEALPIPPTRLKNFSLFKPFELFVSMYGLPRYNEIDPTPLVAIAYSIIFGLMFGDIGQGLVLFIAGLLLFRFKKMDFGKIISTVGVFATLGGFLYGSLFGYENFVFGIKPLESTEHFNMVMIGSIVIGVFLILLVMVINIINGLKQKNYSSSLFGQNGIAGLVFYLGVLVLILSMLGYGSKIVTIPYVALTVVIPLLSIFFRQPLGRLLAKKKDLFPDGKGSFFLENIFELIEILLSYATNTISFIRIGAFALVHAGMMMFVYIIANLSGNGENIFVIIIGNIVVMGLEGLIVGIQVLRLQFYELFGRFFSGDGREFTPISTILGPKEN